MTPVSGPPLRVEPAPVVEAFHLSLSGPEGPVFTDVSLAVWPGRLTVLAGPSGSGRSSLLLALGGRLRGGSGALIAEGRPVRTRATWHRLRLRSSLARLGTIVGPEPRLTVEESLAERALLDAVPPVAARRAFAAAEDQLGVHLDRWVLVERLRAYDRTALAVALARVRPAELVLLDDADVGLDRLDQHRLMAALVDVARSGPAVLISTVETAEVPADADLVTLAPAQEVHR